MVEATCIYTSDEREQTISTPNFPSTYISSNKFCTWKILAPLGSIVKIDRFSYDMDYHAKLYIFDAPTALFIGSGYKSLAKLSGYGTSAPLTSNGSDLFLWFSQGAMATSNPGFKLHYSLEGRLVCIHNKHFWVYCVININYVTFSDFCV